MIRNVTLAEVPAARRVVLDNLLQLYLHDFSEFASIGSPHGEVDADGRFDYAWLDNYWQDEDRVPLLIHADGHVAGFVLLNRWSALNRPLDRSIAEFFVLRKYRRSGVGTRAASLAFSRHKGRWEVSVASYNQPALAFWRKILPIVAGADVEPHAGDGVRWSGTVFCFCSPARPYGEDNASRRKPTHPDTGARQNCL